MVTMNTQESSGYYTAVGEALYLSRESKYHSSWTLSDFEDNFLMPLLLDQYHVYKRNKDPIGIVTWAWIDDPTKDAILKDQRYLLDNEWSNGENLLISDFIAPYGDAIEIANDLKNNLFRNQIFFSLGRDQHGSIRKIYQWKGRNRSKVKVFS